MSDCHKVSGIIVSYCALYLCRNTGVSTCKNNKIFEILQVFNKIIYKEKGVM